MLILGIRDCEQASLKSVRREAGSNFIEVELKATNRLEARPNMLGELAAEQSIQP